VHGSVIGDRLMITYLCVDPAFRGLGIALCLKGRLHEEGRRLGATHVITGNEHANVAVRGLNTRLGYRRLHGEVRVQQRHGTPALT
jgi:GNAT superfamily N-acetyltransferase